MYSSILVSMERILSILVILKEILLENSLLIVNNWNEIAQKSQDSPVDATIFGRMKFQHNDKTQVLE